MLVKTNTNLISIMLSFNYQGEIIISIMISLNNQNKIRFNTEMRIEFIDERVYL